jgi:hypothetical protein
MFRKVRIVGRGGEYVVRSVMATADVLEAARVPAGRRTTIRRGVKR